MNSACVYIFRSGKKKGQQCGKTTEGPYCDVHKARLLKPIIRNVSIHETDSLESLHKKFLETNLSTDNKLVIEKKFHHTNSLKFSTAEFHKNLTWLRHALAFPYNKTIPVPVSCEPGHLKIKHSKVVDFPSPTLSLSATNDYISQVYNKLDDYVYGMESVKEEIMTFVCKRIANPSASDHILALQGGYG